MGSLTEDQIYHLYLEQNPFVQELLAQCDEGTAAAGRFKTAWSELPDRLPGKIDPVRLAHTEDFVNLLTTPERARDYIASCGAFRWHFNERTYSTAKTAIPSHPWFCHAIPLAGLDPVLIRALASQSYFAVLQFAIRDDFKGWPPEFSKALEDGALAIDAKRHSHDFDRHQTSYMTGHIAEGKLDLGHPAVQHVFAHVKDFEETNKWVRQYKTRYSRAQGLALYFIPNRAPLSTQALEYLAAHPDFTPGALVGLCHSHNQPVLPVEFWRILVTTWSKRKGPEYKGDTMTYWPGYDQYPEIRSLIDLRRRSTKLRHTLVSEAGVADLWDIVAEPPTYPPTDPEEAITHTPKPEDWNAPRSILAAKRLLTEGHIATDQDLARLLPYIASRGELAPFWSSHSALGPATQEQVLILTENETYRRLSPINLEGTIVLDWILSHATIKSAKRFLEHLTPVARQKAEAVLDERRATARRAKYAEKRSMSPAIPNKTKKR